LGSSRKTIPFWESRRRRGTKPIRQEGDSLPTEVRRSHAETGGSSEKKAKQKERKNMRRREGKGGEGREEGEREREPP